MARTVWHYRRFESRGVVLMCCFSRPVEHVAQTKIFARTAGKDRQYIVYSMTIDAGKTWR